MTTLVPNRLLFSFEFPLRQCRVAPRVDGDVSEWSEAFRLPRLSELDGKRDFADFWAGWNENGIHIACRIKGKREPLICDPTSFWTGDNIRLCIDTRDARNVKRATRYCHQFYFLPTGAGKKLNGPVAGMNPIQRAKEQPNPINSADLVVASRVHQDGYELEAHVRATALTGFNPSDFPRIGFYYIIEDRELGQQFLTVGDDLLWHVDPSTWPTAVLSR